MASPFIDAVRREVDDLAVELERLENKVRELEETEQKLRNDLRDAEREADIAAGEMPPCLATLVKAYVSHTAGATRAEHIDTIEMLSPDLASVVRALL